MGPGKKRGILKSAIMNQTSTLYKSSTNNQAGMAYSHHLCYFLVDSFLHIVLLSRVLKIQAWSSPYSMIQVTRMCSGLVQGPVVLFLKVGPAEVCCVDFCPHTVGIVDTKLHPLYS